MLALISGSGALPAAVVKAYDGSVLVCALAGATPKALTVDVRFRIETLGSLLADLKQRGVTEVCFAGGIDRPAINPAEIDAATLPLVPVIQQALLSGDDGALRAGIAVFERAGFAVRGAHEIAPGLLMAPGCPSQTQTDPQDETDAARGAAILTAMAASDIGQACAVKGGQALAVESVFGTDWMLSSLTKRPDGKGGVFCKAPKPGQDRRADLPTIGVATVQKVAQAGLRGLVIEAGGVIVLDQPAVVAECDRLGLFLWVREAPA